MKNPIKSLFVAGALFGAGLAAGPASANDAGVQFEKLQQSGAETAYTQGINALSGGAYGYGGGRGYGGGGYGGRGYGRGYYGGRGYGRGYGYGQRRFGGRGYYGGRGYGRGYGLGYRF